MIESRDLVNRAEGAATLTPRQREVRALYCAYVAVAEEPPSSGWIARRLRISRKSAYLHVMAIREKGQLP